MLKEQNKKNIFTADIKTVKALAFDKLCKMAMNEDVDADIIIGTLLAYLDFINLMEKA